MKVLPFSARTNWPQEHNELSRLTQSLRKDGVSLLDLTVSNPTACKFQYLNQEILRPFTDPQNLSYQPDPRGLMKSREIICQYYEKKGMKITPDQIFITANTSEAYSFIFKLIFEPQDLLLAPQPSYPLLDYLAGLHDITLGRYQLDPQKQWSVDLTGFYERQLQDPKGVLVVNPNNPTGSFLRTPELAELNIFSKNRNITIISDEVFFDYPLAEAPKDKVSCASNRHSLAFTLSGISKVLGLPQMKLSWIVVSGPEDLRAEAIRRMEIISDTYLSACTPTQNALSAWFGQEKLIQGEILQRIQKNYNFLVSRFSAGGAIRFFPVQGGWHAPIQLPSTQTDEEWACLLLKKDHLLTHPGYLFDFSEGSYLVLSLLIPEADFKEGLEKIAKRILA